MLTTLLATLSITCHDVKSVYQEAKCCGAEPDTPLPEECSGLSLNDLNTEIKALQDKPAPVIKFAFLSCNDPGLDEGFSGSHTVEHQEKLWNAVEATKSDYVINLGDNVYGDIEDTVLAASSQNAATAGSYSLSSGTWSGETGEEYFFETLKWKYGLLDDRPAFSRMKHGVLEWDQVECEYAWKRKPHMLAVWDDHDSCPNNAGRTCSAKERAKAEFVEFWDLATVNHFNSSGINSPNIVLKHEAESAEHDASECKTPADPMEFIGASFRNLNLVYPQSTEGIMQQYTFDVDHSPEVRYKRGFKTIDVIGLDDHFYRQEMSVWPDDMSELNAEYFGDKQKKWLERYFATRSAWVTFIVAGSPLFAPGYENDDNIYYYPGAAKFLVNLINKYAAQNVVFVAGDMHTMGIVRDARYTKVPITSMIISGAHNGGTFMPYNPEQSYVWGSRVSGSMFGTVEVYGANSKIGAGIRLTQHVRRDNVGEYEVVDEVFLPMESLQGGGPLSETLPAIDSFVHEFTPAVSTAAAFTFGMSNGASKLTFSAEDAVHLTIARSNGDLLLDDAPMKAKTQFTYEFPGTDLSYRLTYGENITLTMRWIRGDAILSERTVAHQVTYVNDAVKSLELLDLNVNTAYLISSATQLSSPLSLAPGVLMEAGVTNDPRVQSLHLETVMPYYRDEIYDGTTLSVVESDGLNLIQPQTRDFQFVYGAGSELLGAGFPATRFDYSDITITFKVMPSLDEADQISISVTEADATPGEVFTTMKVGAFIGAKSGKYNLKVFGTYFAYKYNNAYYVSGAGQPVKNVNGIAPIEVKPIDVTMHFRFDEAMAIILVNDKFLGLAFMTPGFSGVGNVVVEGTHTSLYKPLFGDVRVYGTPRATPLTPAPADRCETAKAVTALGVPTTLDATQMTRFGELGWKSDNVTTPQLLNSYVASHDVGGWFKFTAPETATYKFSTCAAGGPDTDLILTSSCDPATFILGGNGDGAGETGCQEYYSVHRQAMTAGETAYVSVSAWRFDYIENGVYTLIVTADD